MELLFNKTPDYQFLRTFGYLCYPYTRPYNKHKIQFTSKQCVFLVYSAKHKGYLCLSSEGKTYISRHVIFDELHFPIQQNHNFLCRLAKSSQSNTQFLPSIPVFPHLPNVPCSNRFFVLEHVTHSTTESPPLLQEPQTIQVLTVPPVTSVTVQPPCVEQVPNA